MDKENLNACSGRISQSSPACIHSGPARQALQPLNASPEITCRAPKEPLATATCDAHDAACGMPPQVLPEDCIRLIAAKLPVVDLMRFSCTSRDWNLSLAEQKLEASFNARTFGLPQVETMLRWIRDGRGLDRTSQVYFLLRLVEAGFGIQPSLLTQAKAFVASTDKQDFKQALLAIYAQQRPLRPHMSHWRGPELLASILSSICPISEFSEAEQATLVTGWARADGQLPPVATVLTTEQIISGMPVEERRRINERLRSNPENAENMASISRARRAARARATGPAQ